MREFLRRNRAVAPGQIAIQFLCFIGKRFKEFRLVVANQKVLLIGESERFAVRPIRYVIARRVSGDPDLLAIT